MTHQNPSHQPVYDPPHQSEADQQFYCRVACSCGEFERTAKSKVSGTRARTNARSAFARHLKALAAQEEPEQPMLDLAKAPLAAGAPEGVEDPEVEEEVDETGVVKESPEPASEATPEPDAEPEAPLAPPRRLPALLMAVGFIVVLVALVGGIALVNLLGAPSDGSDQDRAEPRQVELPAVETITQYGSYLRKTDAVFKPIATKSLTIAGKRVCKQYSVGLNVVEITSSMIGRGVVDSRQARILISAAVPVFCPRYSEPVRRELSGLA